MKNINYSELDETGIEYLERNGEVVDHGVGYNVVDVEGELIRLNF